MLEKTIVAVSRGKRRNRGRSALREKSVEPDVILIPLKGTPARAPAVAHALMLVPS